MSEEVSEKTLYDGRLLTHQRLSNAWIMFANSLSIKDYDNVITSLNIVLLESAGALKEESINDYLTKLDIISTKINIISNGSKINRNNINENTIKKELIRWCIDLKKETKNLYLPFEMNDINPDDLFKKIEKGMG